MNQKQSANRSGYATADFAAAPGSMVLEDVIRAVRSGEPIDPAVREAVVRSLQSDHPLRAALLVKHYLEICYGHERNGGSSALDLAALVMDSSLSHAESGWRQYRDVLQRGKDDQFGTAEP